MTCPSTKDYLDGLAVLNKTPANLVQVALTAHAHFFPQIYGGT